MSRRHESTPAHRRPAPQRWRTVVGVLGELLVTAGVVLGLYVGWQLWFTGLYTSRQQQALLQQVQRDWGNPTPAPSGPPASAGPSAGASASAPAPPPVPGNGIIAVLRIPRLGSDWVKVVVPGVGVDDLRRGPGHYPGTALPGQPGNFAVAGHRTSYGQPFFRLDALGPGDLVGVETESTWFVYTVRDTHVVAPTDTGAILPVPGQPGRTPTQALLTLTTCTPLFSTAQRLVVHAQLTAQQPRSAGLPAGLG